MLGAKLSIQNGYCKPELQTNEKVFVIVGISHPIVEKIHINTEYITNDVQLGIVIMMECYYLEPMRVEKVH